MPYFTCNHCGESAKKPAVAKHYQMKCRGAPVFVSCMDCMKDFRGEEYVEHTRCISELEKYSGKDYVPKESQNKGQKKQDSWLEIVRSILTTKEYNLSASLKSVFQRLQTFDNVPRKKVKFQNFVTNSFKIDKKISVEVWNILEKELEKMKNTKKNENTQKDEKISNGHSKNGNIEKSEKELENDDQPEPLSENGKKKKNKKTKKRKVEAENTEENVENIDEVKPKKVKKSDNAEEPIAANSTNGVIEEPKIKKKKLKSEVVENDSLNPTGQEEIKSFDWFLTISQYAVDGMNVEKLKKKVFKKYGKFNPEAEINNKVEKTFKKYLKKSGVGVENDVIKVVG